MQGAGDGLAEAVDGPCSLGVLGQMKLQWLQFRVLNHPPQGFPQLCPRGAGAGTVPGAGGIWGGSGGEEPGLWVTLPEGIVKLLSQWVRPVLLLKLIIEEGKRVCGSVYHVAGPGLAHVWGIYRLWEKQRRGE